MGMQKDVLDPSSTDRALLQLVRICRAQRRFTEAETLLASGIALDASWYGASEFPDSTGAGPLFLDLAMVYIDEGALPQAAHAVKTALRWDSRPHEAAAAYALVLEREGRSEEALAWRQRASDVSRKADSSPHF
jgi:Tfp pilus assembly protein PilF